MAEPRPDEPPGLAQAAATARPPRGDDRPRLAAARVRGPDLDAIAPATGCSPRWRGKSIRLNGVLWPRASSSSPLNGPLLLSPLTTCSSSPSLDAECGLAGNSGMTARVVGAVTPHVTVTSGRGALRSAIVVKRPPWMPN